MEGLKKKTLFFQPLSTIGNRTYTAGLCIVKTSMADGSCCRNYTFSCFLYCYRAEQTLLGIHDLIYTELLFIGIQRYVNVQNSSVIMDIFIAFILICTFLYALCGGKIPWQRANNKLLYISLVWMIYVFFELFNPSAVTEAWIFTRGSFYNFTLLVLLTSLLLDKVKDIKTILFLLSIFTLIAVGKTLIQRYMGFDSGEMDWLIRSTSYKTHLLRTGIRYFSIFSDAGNFGSNMGMAAIIYMILSFLCLK